MARKIFYLSLAAFVLALIFFGAYNFVFKNNVTDPVADKTKKETGKDTVSPAPKITPPAPSAIVNKINEVILGAVIGGDGMIYYSSLEEKSLKKATMEGKDKTVLLGNLPGTPSRLVWSPSKEKALVQLKLSDGRSLWYLADLSATTLVPLKPEMSRPAWNNLGDKILYQYTDPASGKRTLNLSNPDGSQWKKLADLDKDSFVAPVPQSVLISYWNRPNAFEETRFASVGIGGDRESVLLTQQYGADYLWSPRGDQVLVSSSSQKGGSGLSLHLINNNGGELRGLSIPTLVSKAVWSNDGKVLYYALPGSLPPQSVLPNDYFEKPLHTTDTFWKIDLETGKKSRLVELKDVNQVFDSADLFLTPDEEFLFFTDRVSRKLYRIEL